MKSGCGKAQSKTYNEIRTTKATYNTLMKTDATFFVYKLTIKNMFVKLDPCGLHNYYLDIT